MRPSILCDQMCKLYFYIIHQAGTYSIQSVHVELSFTCYFIVLLISVMYVPTSNTDEYVSNEPVLENGSRCFVR